jgi:hypothetical protein
MGWLRETRGVTADQELKLAWRTMEAEQLLADARDEAEMACRAAQRRVQTDRDAAIMRAQIAHRERITQIEYDRLTLATVASAEDERE